MLIQDWLLTNCKFAAPAVLPKLVPPWKSNNAPSAAPAPARPQPPQQAPQQPRPPQEKYNPKADWSYVEPRLKNMGILPGSFEYAQWERIKALGQDAVLKYVADLEKQYYGRSLASWLRGNCVFAQSLD